MALDTALAGVYDRLLDLGRELADAGYNEAAYHALMAAVHCAESAGDVARLGHMAALLRDHRRRIDALEPPHKLSTASSHGGRSIFEMGAVTAEAAALRLENQKRVREIKQGRTVTGTSSGRP